MTRKFGTHRTVYLIGSWAIKIPVFAEWRLFLYGLLANAQEAAFSKTRWPELCPVVFGMPGGWFIIMRRAEPISDEQFFALDYEKFRWGPNYVVPVENKPDSFGLLAGKIVAVDYGS